MSRRSWSAIVLLLERVIASEAKQSPTLAHAPAGGDCFGAPRAPRNDADKCLLLRNSRLLDHVAPLGDVARQAIVHLLRRRRFGMDAEPAIPLLYVRRSERAYDLGVEIIDDLGRRAGAHHGAVVARDHIGRISALHRGRHVLEQRIARKSTRLNSSHIPL